MTAPVPGGWKPVELAEPAGRVNTALPERPTIDGLEPTWARRWERAGRTPVRPDAARARPCTRSTRRRRRSAARCTSGTSSPTRTPTSSRATSGCAGARCSTRWAGTTTACPPSGGCRTTSACAATPPCPTTRTSSRPRKPGEAAGPDLPAQLHRAVRAAHRRGREGASRSCGAGSGSRSTGRMTYRTIGTRARAASQRAFLRNLARGEAYLGRGADAVGRHVPHRGGPGRAGGPGAARRLPPAAFARADGADLEIATTRPELLPACVALVAHPDDERYRDLFGTPCRTPVFDVEVPVLAHRLADPEKGTGIAMICTFGDTTDVTVVARAGPADPHRRRPRRPDRAGAAGRPGRRAARAAYAQLAGADRAHSAGARGRAAARAGTLVGEPQPDHARGEVLREGRQAARDRHHPAVVHPQRRPRRRAARRRCWLAAAS